MVREVEARLKLSAIDRTQKAFASVERNLNRIEQKAKAVSRTQAAYARASAAVANSTNEMFLSASRALAPAAIAYGVATSVRRFAEVERSVERIGITAGATAEETKKAFGTIGRVAQQYATSQDEVTDGLNTLVSTGRELDDALAFLPSVTATALASGAAISDIALTADAVGRNFGIAGDEMQGAFDIMVAGGKAGMFELKDMASYLPSLAPAFAALGYEGDEGLKKLIASLQVVRTGAGTASEAASNFAGVLSKIESSETVNTFKKFGVDLRREMAKAKKEGKDLLQAFVDLTNRTIKGDLSKLPQLFGDQQTAAGMRSLISQTQMMTDVMGKLGQAAGSTQQDVDRLLQGTQAKIDRLASSWDGLVKTVGAASASVLAPAMDAIAGAINAEADYGAGLAREEAAGGSFGESFAEFRKQYGEVYGDHAFNGAAVLTAYKKEMARFGRGEIDSPYASIQREAALRKGGGGRPEAAAFMSDLSAAPGSRPLGSYSTGAIPAPYLRSNMEAATRNADRLAYNQGQMLAADATRKAIAARPDPSFGLSGLSAGPSGGPVPVVIQGINAAAARASAVPAAAPIYDTSFGDPMGGGVFGDPDALRNALEQGGQSVAQGGEQARQAIDQGGANLPQQGQAAGEAFAGAAGSQLDAQAASAGATFGRAAAAAFNAGARVPAGGGSLSGRNTGRSMPNAGTPQSGAQGPHP